jgi:hypothetical protein
MDQAFIDEAGTMYASDHNATLFNLQLLIPVTEPGTEAPTEAPTEPVTPPASEAPTETPDGTPTESIADGATEAPTTQAKSGCDSVIALSAIVLLLPAAAVSLRKRKED